MARVSPSLLLVGPLVWMAISSRGSSCNDTDALGALQCVQVLRGALGSNHTSGLADRWRHHLRLKEEAAEVSQLLEEHWEICSRYRGLVVSGHVVTTPATQAGPDFLDRASRRPCTSQRHGRMRCHHQIWKQHAKICFAGDHICCNTPRSPGKTYWQQVHVVDI